jgi:hypothetical protein
MFYYLEAKNVDPHTTLGRIGDVSENGLMLLTDVPLELNAQYSIEIQLPESLTGSQKILAVTIVARWIKPDHNPAISCAGCQIIDPGEHAQAIIQSLIEYYGFSDGYKEFRQLHAN